MQLLYIDKDEVYLSTGKYLFSAHALMSLTATVTGNNYCNCAQVMYTLLLKVETLSGLVTIITGFFRRNFTSHPQQNLWDQKTCIKNQYI